MSIMSILAIIFFLAFLVEALVEYIFGQAAQHIPALQPYQWTLMYVALAVGVGAALVYRLDLVFLLSEFLGGSIQQTLLGTILTGLAIGRGSNFIHDITARFFVKAST